MEKAFKYRIYPTKKAGRTHSKDIWLRKVCVQLFSESENRRIQDQREVRFLQ